MLCGVQFGLVSRSKTKTTIYLTLFWIGTLLLSLLPGYFSAKIYTFGWQYGYFPGLVWDEAMELQSEYWIARLVEVVAIVCWVMYDRRILEEKRKRQYEIRKIFSLWEYWQMTIAAAFFGVFYFLQFSDNDLHNHLSEKIIASENVYIHFARGSLSNDEKLLHCYEIKNYIRGINSIYGVNHSPSIDIYVFPNPDDLYLYIGNP